MNKYIQEEKFSFDEDEDSSFKSIPNILDDKKLIKVGFEGDHIKAIYKKKFKGKIISFEGIDHSFKETNSKVLYDYIQHNVTDLVKLISFPNYESNSSYFVTNYLNGKYGNVNDVDPFIISQFYAMDRYDTLFNKYKIYDLLEVGYWIIFDRYIGSNLCFQSAKVINNKSFNYYSKKDKEKVIKFAEKEYNYEINELGLPIPDITLFMKSNLIDTSGNRDNKHRGKDIHELNYKYLKNVRDISSLIINNFDWKTVKIDKLILDKYEYKSKNEIFNEIIKVLKNNDILI